MPNLPRFAAWLLAIAPALAVAPAARAESAGSCGSAALIVGQPRYQGQDRPNPNGANLKSDPPIQFRSLVMQGSKFFSNNGMEIWHADLVAGTMRRVAGEEPKIGDPKLGDGPCAAARFMSIHGMAALSDGSLIVADFKGNAVLKVTNPSTPACAVEYVAGNNTPQQREAPHGDVDGPGKASKLNGPEWPLVDGADNVYIIDSGSNKLKKIAADADHTVSTVATLYDTKGYGYRGMVFVGDKLYVVGNTFSNAIILEMNPETGATKKIVDSGAKLFGPLDASTAPSLSSVATDGKNLFVTGQGYIWRVSPQGKIVHVAGAGSPIDYPKDYDPAVARPAKKALLRFRNGDVSIMGTTTAMAWQDGVLFWRARADAPYILSIGGCK